jgi:hypothetical protein
MTRGEAMALFQNRSMVNQLVSGPPKTLVSVALKPDRTPSGYAWSAGQGPAEHLHSYALVVGDVVVASRRPISLVFG